MKAIYLAFIIIIFGFATNKEQYNNITTDTFSQKYYNLSELNNYFFVFPAKLNELTHIVLRTYYLSRNVFQYININEYKTYTSNYTEIVKKTTPNYQYMNIIINNETYTNFSVTTQNSGVKYIGIEFAPTIDLEFLIVTIVSIIITLSLCFYLYIRLSPLTYYLYTLFPCYFFWRILSNFKYL